MAPSLVADHSIVEIHHESGNDGGIPLDNALDLSGPDFTQLAAGYFDPDIEFADFWDPSMNDKDIQYHSLEYSSLPSTGQPTEKQQVIYFPDVSIPAVPSQMVRSFIQRPKLNTGAQRITSLLFHTLKSYPLMMVRDKALPPFIHPQLVSSDVENNDMEPLTNCMSLVYMLSSRIHGSRKLFWKNVRMECEHLCADVR